MAAFVLIGWILVVLVLVIPATLAFVTFPPYRHTPEPSFEIGDIFSVNAYFDWHKKGCGFGQLSLTRDPSTGKLLCRNECMSRESVRKMLHALADKIADEAILEEV